MTSSNGKMAFPKEMSRYLRQLMRNYRFPIILSWILKLPLTCQ